MLDLRGHGDSDTTFATHGDVVTGQDALALVEHLGGPAVLVGNSMGAGAAALGGRRAARPRRRPRADRPVPARPAQPAIATAAMHGAMRVLLRPPVGRPGLGAPTTAR